MRSSPLYRHLYIWLMFTLGAALFTCIFLPFFYTTRGRTLRIGLFVAFGGMGALPVCHLAFFHSFNALSVALLHNIAWMGGTCAHTAATWRHTHSATRRAASLRTARPPSCDRRRSLRVAAHAACTRDLTRLTPSRLARVRRSLVRRPRGRLHLFGAVARGARAAHLRLFVQLAPAVALLRRVRGLLALGGRRAALVGHVGRGGGGVIRA
jgi:hypothetical protein